MQRKKPPLQDKSNIQLVDEFNDSADDFAIPKLKRKCKGKLPASRIQDEHTSQKSRESCEILEDWTLIPCSHYCGLYLEGHRRQDPAGVYWMTSMVQSRVDERCLVTVSGRTYKLQGNIFLDSDVTKVLSEKILRAFKNGFPRNWKHLINAERRQQTANKESEDVYDILENVGPMFKTKPLTSHSCQPTPGRSKNMASLRSEDAKRVRASKASTRTASQQATGRKASDSQSLLGTIKTQHTLLKNSTKTHKTYKNRQSMSCGLDSDNSVIECEIAQTTHGSASSCQLSDHSGNQKHAAMKIDHLNENGKSNKAGISTKSTTKHGCSVRKMPARKFGNDHVKAVRSSTRQKKPVNYTYNTRLSHCSDDSCEDVTNTPAHCEAKSSIETGMQSMTSNKTKLQERRKINTRTQSKQSKCKMADSEKTQSPESQSLETQCEVTNSRKTKSRAQPKKTKAKPQKTKDLTQSKESQPVCTESTSQKPWTKKEAKELLKVMQSLDKTSPEFWQQVAAAMVRRSEEDCRNYYYQGTDNYQAKKPATKPKKNKEAVTEGKQITATKGTMKRKRQVREFMDNMNKNYEDDYFDSTPVKAAKPLKIPRLEMNDSFNMIVEEMGNWKSPGTSLIRTPGMKYAGMPTAMTTANESALTPFAPADQYVHKILKSRKGQRWSNKDSAANQTEAGAPESPVPGNISVLLKRKSGASSENAENHVDSDEEFIDYFSDSEK